MQLIIDIPEETFKYYAILANKGEQIGNLERIILDGTPLKGDQDFISREEAIGIVARIKEMHIDDREQYPINYGTICDIDLALQRLPSVTPSYNSIKTELEPCDDCISRKRLLSRIDAERKHLLDIKMDGAEHIIVHHARRIIEDMPSVTPSIPDVEDNYNIGYTCGYTDAMVDIAESEDKE